MKYAKSSCAREGQQLCGTSGFQFALIGRHWTKLNMQFSILMIAVRTMTTHTTHLCHELKRPMRRRMRLPTAAFPVAKDKILAARRKKLNSRASITSTLERNCTCRYPPTLDWAVVRAAQIMSNPYQSIYNVNKHPPNSSYSWEQYTLV